MRDNRNKYHRLQSLKLKDPGYPEILSTHLDSQAPTFIHAIGNLSILRNPLSGLFCSVRCPGDLILKTYDLTRELRESSVTVISGFHSPIENDCLDILLRGNQPVIICPGRSIHNMRVPKEWQNHIETGRLLLLSPFPEKNRYATEKQCTYRNHFIAALANRIFISHAAPNSKTMALSRKAISWKKCAHTFNHPENEHLIGIGAQPIKEYNNDTIKV